MSIKNTVMAKHNSDNDEHEDQENAAEQSSTNKERPSEIHSGNPTEIYSGNSSEIYSGNLSDDAPDPEKRKRRWRIIQKWSNVLFQWCNHLLLPTSSQRYT